MTTRPVLASTEGLFRAARTAYADPADEARWLLAVAEALRPAIDGGLGVVGWSYHRDGDWYRVGTAVMAGGDPATASYPAAFLRHPHREFVRATYEDERLASSVTSICARRRIPFPDDWEDFASPAIRDVVGLKWSGPDAGVIFASPRPAPTRLPPPVRRVLERAVVHVGAGWRLRGWARGDAPAAIVEPEGKLAHAVGDASSSGARAELRRAVRAAERARSTRRGEDGEALGLWRGLVSGRWSLVDQFDSDGRRFYVAVENPPRVRSIVALSPRQRSIAELVARGLPNKTIAYTLGLSEGTVASGLSEVMQKLGLTSRAELVASVRAARGPRSVP